MTFPSSWLRSSSARGGLLIAAALLLRVDLLGVPFIEYFSNRQVQNALPLRLLQEGRFTMWTLPTDFGDMYGIAEFQFLPWIVGRGYALLEAVGAARLPTPGDAEAASLYYHQVALLGRVWSLSMATLAMAAVFKLLRDGWSEPAALYAIAAYAVLPFNRFFDQLFLAEPTIMGLSFIGTWQLWKWGSRPSGGWWRFLAAGAAFALVLLLKASHVWIGFPIVALLWRRQGWRCVYQWTNVVLAALVLAPGWYFYYVRGSWVTQNGMDGFAFENLKRTFTEGEFFRQYSYGLVYRHLWTIWTPIGTVLAAFGLWHAWKRPAGAGRWLTVVLCVWAGGWIFYWFFAGQMSGHYYYQEPGLPIAAAFMGAGAEALHARTRPAWRWALFGAAAAGLLGFNEVVQRVNDEGSRYWRGMWCRTILDAGLAADRRLPPGARVVYGGRGAVHYMLVYYVHRDGWALTPDEGDPNEAPARLEQMRAQGAEFYFAPFGYDGPKHNGVIYDRAVFGEQPIAAHLLARYRIVEETSTHILFDLRPASGALPGYH